MECQDILPRPFHLGSMETEVKGQNDIKITNCKKHEGNEKGWVVIAGVLKLFLRNRSEPTTLLCQTNTWFESSQQSF